MCTPVACRGVALRLILALCEPCDWPCYVVCGHRLIERRIPENPRRRTGVAFAYADGQAWFYQNTHAMSRMQARGAK